VGGDHPLEALLREIQVGPDRGQRHVHDRHVEHDHELSAHDQPKPPPALAILVSDCPVCPNVCSHFLSPPIIEFCHDNRTQRWCATLIPHDNSFHRSSDPPDSPGGE